MSGDALIPSVSIEALLERRAAIVERLTKAHEAMLEVNELAQASFGEAHRYRSVTLYEHSRNLPAFTGEGALAAYIQHFDANAWDYLLNESGLRTFMDAKTRKKWDEDIYKRQVPELTHENIYATFRVMHDRRGDMFEQGVLAVFRSLSWSYKTNQPVAFGKRIILEYAVSAFRGEMFGGLEHAAANKVDDLLRVFHVLDGKPEPDHRNGSYHRTLAAKWPKENKVVDLDYFSMKGFKNGNAHVTFTRPDLVDKMNEILAKHYPDALPPAR